MCDERLTGGSAETQLPDMAAALHLLEAEHRRRHFVEYEPDFEVFIRNLKVALDGHQLPRRAFDELFSDTNLTRHPDCDGCADPHDAILLPSGHAQESTDRDLRCVAVVNAIHTQ